MRREGWGWLAVGLLLGAAAGAIAGLLMAPMSGREARSRLDQARNRVLADAGEALERVADIADAIAEWGWRLVGAEADRTRAQLAELRADVEKLSASH